MKTLFVFLCLALAFTSCTKDNPVSTTEDPNGYSNYELYLDGIKVVKDSSNNRVEILDYSVNYTNSDTAKDKGETYNLMVNETNQLLTVNLDTEIKINKTFNIKVRNGYGQFSLTPSVYAKNNINGQTNTYPPSNEVIQIKYLEQNETYNGRTGYSSQTIYDGGLNRNYKLYFKLTKK